jgi:hypothetical protein
MSEGSDLPEAAGARSFVCRRRFRNPADRSPQIDEVAVVGNRNLEPLLRREGKQGIDLGSIDADSEARHRLEAVLTRLEQAIQRADARVDPAALDPSD